MLTQEWFRKELELAFAKVDFDNMSYEEQDTFLLDTIDMICDWSFWISQLETWDLICYWYIENLYDNRNYYVELDYQFLPDVLPAEEVIDYVCDYYQEYLDMYWFFKWVN